MTHNNYYDVTQWHIGNPYKDIGEVINSIILDIKNDKPQLMLITAGNRRRYLYSARRLSSQDAGFIDISYLKIMGAGHGFVSSSIRFNTPAVEWAYLHDVWRVVAVFWSIFVCIPAMKNMLALHFT